MIKHPGFHVEPWSLREMALDLDVLAQAESVFALSNGHLGWRGNLDEGEPHGLPGSYLNGVYEERPLGASEAIYGLPQSGQTVINVANGKLIRLFVDDEPFDVRYGKLLAQGTAAEIIAQQHLSSWAIHGTGLIQLQDELKGKPGVNQTVVFGNDLHVSGEDAAALEQTVKSVVAATSLTAEPVDTGLEDVFIYMMGRSADNWRATT